MPPNALSIFSVESPHAVRTLRTHLMERIADCREALAAGSAQDWPDYNKRVGVIQGLRDAISICDQYEAQER